MNEISNKFINEFVDYHGMYQTLLDIFKSEFTDNKLSFISYISDCVYDHKKASDLWDFIFNEESNGFIESIEPSEENTIVCDEDIMYISFTQDTSTYNEGGSHLGGFEYIFTVDIDTKYLIGFECVNYN